MRKNLKYEEAQELLLRQVTAVSAEMIHLEQSAGRVLAETVSAKEHVPPFDRSPYDGYALRSMDVTEASAEHPVMLQVTEQVAAGMVPSVCCTKGTAVRIMTGALLPEGADCIVMYEKTRFTEKTVEIFSSIKAGSNIVRAGEDVKKGTILADKGQVIDAGTAGTLAAQGMTSALVYRRPRIGILSTGSEITEPGTVLENGRIYDSNRAVFSAALTAIGCEPVSLGLAEDDAQVIAQKLLEGLEQCDGIVCTGGVSVGDYDMTPEAMERAGITLLFRGIEMKPGMACAYGVKDGKLVCGLSGNPASALTNFYAAAVPALKKLAGCQQPCHTPIQVTLKNGFSKKSPVTRFLRGRLDLSDGTVGMVLQKEQGNAVISSAIGCNVMAVIPAGSGPVEKGTVLEGFFI